MAKVKHIGFKGAVRKVMNSEHISEARARAIIASGARHASAAAKRRNPRLKRVGKAKAK